MIAYLHPPDEFRREFEMDILPELAPRLRSHLRHSRDNEELAAEAIAISWMLFVSARRRGQPVTPGTLAFYGARAARAGRSITGSTSLDALSTTQLARDRIDPVASLSQMPDGSSNFYRVFGDRRGRWSAADLVAVKLDWAAFATYFCDSRDRSIIRHRLSGHRNSEIAEALGISRAAVSQRLGAMHRRWTAASAA